jgi:CubicO group peptidase (beta-lactamase class C family)
MGRARRTANGERFLATECFDQQMIDFIDERNIPGATVAVMYRGKIVYERAYGTRDAPGVGGGETQTPERPALPSTPFRIASVSKTITSLTLLRMAQANMITLEDQPFAEDGALYNTTLDYQNVDQLFTT